MTGSSPSGKCSTWVMAPSGQRPLRLVLPGGKGAVMGADSGPGGLPAGEQPDGGGYRVDARGAMGVQVGEGTQIIYYY